jgi:hypothetical protein
MQQVQRSRLAASKLDGSSSKISVPRNASNAAMVPANSAASRLAGLFGGLIPNHRAIVASTEVSNALICRFLRDRHPAE